MNVNSSSAEAARGSIRTKQRESRLDAVEIGWGDACRADDVVGLEPWVIAGDDDVARDMLGWARVQ